MSRTPRFRKLTAFLFFATLAGLVLASLPGSRLVMISGRSDLTKAHASPQHSVLRTFAPYWRAGYGFSSALVIRNTSRQLPAVATPIVFASNSAPLWLPTSHLAPGEVKRIYLEEALRQVNSTAEHGSLSLQIDQSQSTEIIGEIVITNYSQGIIFDVPLQAGYAGNDSNSLYSSWWLPDNKTDGKLVLFNASEQPMSAHASINGQTSRGSADVRLTAYETQELDLRELMSAAGEANASAGSVSISYEGASQALIPALLLSNPKTGFSFSPRFFPKHDHSANPKTRLNWNYPIVVSGKADASLGFQKQSNFTAYALITNPGDVPVTPQLSGWVTANPATQSLLIPTVPIGPRQTMLIDLTDLTKRSMPKDAGAFTLQVSHSGVNGDLAINVFSVDQRKEFVFTAEGTAKLRSRLDSIYWNIDDDLQSMIVIQNAGDEAVQVQAMLFYTTGEGQLESYKLPRVFAFAKSTQILNLREVIRSGLPDETGKVIPPGASFGTVTIESLGGQQATLVGGNVTFDPDAGECGGDMLPICDDPEKNTGLDDCDIIPIIIVGCELACDPPDTCDTPTGETTVSVGWASSIGLPTIHMWTQTLTPGTGHFGGRFVHERGDGTPIDNCFFPNQEFLPAAVGNTSWLVASDNRWGPDFVGFEPDAVDFYRRNGRAPCGYELHQVMDYLCPFGPTDYQTNTLTATITSTTVSSSRNGHGASRTWP